ncbi:MAG: peptidase [Megasphaera sp.]|jgi:N6-L-threonylcarbamoyladenine synthase|nr:peptidase [Megasphaera sp.]
MKAYIGIDTSCYTTSVCVVDAAYRIVAERRIILTVPEGKRGLSQSNMVYQHTRNLPKLFEEIRREWKGYTICAVAVTDQPRRRQDSYMPAFLAGLGCARTIAALLDVPLYRISHQENHLLAVLRTVGAVGTEPFYGLHLSGGTTDLLYAVPDAQGLAITCLGGSGDISAGQFIDRVGVSLHLPFPAGIYVDRAAAQWPGSVKGSAVVCQEGKISFSGWESKAQRCISHGGTPTGEICQWTLATVWRGVEKLLDTGLAAGMSRLTAAGGVMSNGYLRQQMEGYCQQHKVQLYLAAPGYSADNASGAAFWAAWQERD